VWPTLLFSAALVFTSLVLLAWHVKSWREADHGGLAERDYQFHRRQYRRRMQSSGMLGIIGLLILGHLWVRDNAMLAVYWAGVLGLVVWTVLLAIADLAASRLHYGPHVAEQRTEHLLLKREIENFRRESSSDPPKDQP
jgi:uncharacterized membrane protein